MHLKRKIYRYSIYCFIYWTIPCINRRNSEIDVEIYIVSDYNAVCLHQHVP